MWIKHSAQTLSRLDVLVDQYLDQSDEQKIAWLEQLDQNQPTIAQHLRLLISSEDHLLPARDAAVMPNIEAPNTDDIGLAPTDELPSGAQFGPWKVIRFHTKGGSADIYRGGRADGLFEREVAIKYLRSRAHTSQRRFAREQMLLAKLEHPHIAALLDAGIDGNGVPFLVMPWLQGETFAELDLAKQPLRLRLQWFQQIASAIEFAHQQLIVHCDLKPSNVMLVNNQAMVLDFGLARLVGAEQLQLTQQAFTPAYASPEQLRGEPVAVATDLHALGLMLFELLSCEPAYPKARLSLANAVNTIVYGEQPKLPRIVGFSRAQQYDAQAIIDQLLAKQPKQRYGNASLLLQDCQRLVERQPISVRKRSLWGRMQAAWIRHQRLAWTAVAGLGVATAYGVQYAKQNQRIESEREEAQLQVEQHDAFISHFTTMLSDGGDKKTLRQAMEESLTYFHRYDSNDHKTTANLALELTGIYLTIGDLKAAETAISPIIENEGKLRQLSPRMQLEILFRHIETQEGLGNLDAVENTLPKLEALAKENSNPDRLASIKIIKGRLLRQRNQVSEGLMLQTEGVNLLRNSPNETKYSLGIRFFNLGSAHLDAGNLDQAKSYFHEALENWKNHPIDARSAETALARLLLLQGNCRDALIMLRAVEENYRSNGDTSIYRAQNFIWLARTEHQLGNLRPALEHAKAALDLFIQSLGSEHPNSLTIQLFIAELAIDLNDNVQESVARVEQLAKDLMKQDDLTLMRVRALHLLTLGKLQQADQLFERVEDLDENETSAKRATLWPVQLHRAEIAARLGDRERQQQALDRAMASVIIFQKEGGMGHLEVSLWRQCMAERSATNAVAALAKELGPEHHRVKALARCWD